MFGAKTPMALKGLQQEAEDMFSDEGGNKSPRGAAPRNEGSGKDGSASDNERRSRRSKRSKRPPSSSGSDSDGGARRGEAEQDCMDQTLCTLAGCKITGFWTGVIVGSVMLVTIVIVIIVCTRGSEKEEEDDESEGSGFLQNVGLLGRRGAAALGTTGDSAKPFSHPRLRGSKAARSAAFAGSEFVEVWSSPKDVIKL
ncbi:unnamed protein product [Amoebophrya sp. A120]|nr:unnamed protein product [Amoebophrya sp. A120]|eukprot:GSA120T00018603001.1